LSLYFFLLDLRSQFLLFPQLQVPKELLGGLLVIILPHPKQVLFLLYLIQVIHHVAVALLVSLAGAVIGHFLARSVVRTEVAQSEVLHHRASRPGGIFATQVLLYLPN